MAKYSLDIHNLPNEEWRDIKGYEGHYQVSNMGRVRSLPHIHKAANPYLTKMKLLAIQDNGSGYKYVHLLLKKMYVHRLVAEAFVPNPFKHNEINHKDEDKANNRSSNLEWCSHSYNAGYGTKTARTVATCLKYGIYRKSVEKKNTNNIYGAEKPVVAILQDGSEKHFKSIMEASRGMGTSASKICQCCKGQRNITKGIKWRYA